MKILLPFLFIFCLPLFSFTDESKFKHCPPVEEEATVNTLIKICSFAFLNTGGNQSSCQAGSLDLEVDNNCVGTTEGTVRAINLDQNPVIGYEYPLTVGMPDIYYQYELPNGTNFSHGPIKELTYYGESVSGANGQDYPIFEYHIPISLDVSQWCYNNQTVSLPITILLTKANGDIYPIDLFADANQAFYCQVFEETCNDCNENVLGCTGGYPPLYFTNMCGDCSSGCKRSEEESIVSGDASEITEEENLNLNIQPNPFDELLNVKFSLEKESDVHLDVIDAKGNIIHQLDVRKDKGKHNLRLNTNDFSTGIYFLRININSKMFSEKIVKLK